MKRYFFALALAGGLASCDTLNRLPANTVITETEAAQGIRQALDQGVAKGITTLNRPDGFFGNQAYKLLLPADARKIEGTLRQLGMDALVDKAILQINRAAEDAVGSASLIFREAIQEMTIADALNIIRGPRNAATEYFRQKTTDRLRASFAPIIRSSLDRLNATKYYSDVVSTYNNFPTTLNKINPDLPAYVVDRTVTALFDQVEQEEARIRQNPAARSTEILRRVFGWAARNRAGQ